MRSSAPATDRSRPTPSRKLRGVLLPAEHGSWGLIAEPLLLGLLVAPSLPGLAVAVFAFSAFLLRTPMLRVWRFRQLSSPDPQRGRVRRFLLTNLIVMHTGLAAAALTARGPWLLPIVLASPLALWVLRVQYKGQTRKLWPELVAAIALGSPAAAMLLAAGAPAEAAYWAWGALAIKSITSIVFVRTQIKRFHNRPHARVPMLALHVAVPVALVLFDRGIGMPLLYGALALRAAVLTALPVRSAKHVGWIEVAISLAFVLALSTLIP